MNYGQTLTCTRRVGVMPVERRGRVIAADLGQLVRREEPSVTDVARRFLAGELVI